VCIHTYIYLHIHRYTQAQHIRSMRRALSMVMLRFRKQHLRLSMSSVNTATHCNTQRHTATHCNTLQHTATHCNTLRHPAMHAVASSFCNFRCRWRTQCNTLQHNATHCIALQHSAAPCNTHFRMQHLRLSLSLVNTLHHVVPHCNTRFREQHFVPLAVISENAATHTATYACVRGICVLHCDRGTCCNTLQHHVPHCDTLQHTTTHCNILQHTASRAFVSSICGFCYHLSSVIGEHAATHCNTL